MIKKIIFGIATLFLLAIIVALFRLPSPKYIVDDIAFKHNNKNISGRLAIPRGKHGPFPVAIFVHGDGPVDKTGNGDYIYHWNRLTSQGIACFSWDKQGIGASDGNWEHQDMRDRALEVISAIEFLKKQDSINSHKIGLFGFSQAGWVIPYVSTLSSYPDFIVSISGAINVEAQGEFYNRNRLLRKGLSQVDINKYINNRQNILDLMHKGLTYSEYLGHWGKLIKPFEDLDSRPMSYNRFIFSKKKWPDVRDHINNIECPILLVFGDRDLNVDVNESIKIYNEYLSKQNHPHYKVKKFTNGTHSLVRADKFQDRAINLLDIIIYGENIYSNGYLDYIDQWLNRVVFEDL